jgi:hypothetical protein
VTRGVNKPKRCWRASARPPSIRKTNDVSRSRGDQAFKRSEVLRLIRIAEEGGLSKYTITCGGHYTLSVDKSAPAKESDGPTNEELDQWIMKHEG